MRAVYVLSICLLSFSVAAAEKEVLIPDGLSSAATALRSYADLHVWRNPFKAAKEVDRDPALFGTDPEREKS